MKKSIIIMLFALFPLFLKAGDCETYGKDWTKLFYAKSKIQAKYIVWKFKLANIGQSFYESNGKYYIELTYCDDDLEKIYFKKWSVFVLTAKQLNQIHEIKMIGIDNKGGYLIF